MYTIDHLPGRTARIDGEDWLYFSGTAYLGVVQDTRFQALVKEGVDRYGVHYGGSRLASIRLPLFEEAEALLCRLTGAPAALIVSSGTLAGQLAVRTLGEDADLWFAPDVHPALWPGSKWEVGSRKSEQRPSFPFPGSGFPLFLSNALDSLHARAYDFSWLRDVPAGQPLTVIVDDSHGLGVTGPDGAGIYPQLPAPEGVEVVVISSLGKAFGIPGGVILGPAAVIDRIRESPHFGGASPTPPAFLHAFVAGQAIYRENRARLLGNVRQFRAAVGATGLFQSFDDYPVFYTPDSGLAGYLAARRILVSSFPYPTPADPVVTRVVLNALHTAEDIAILAKQIVERVDG